MKKKAVEQYLTTVFDNALIPDLEKMTSVPPPGLDFGIIMLVCGGIELMGALDQGHIGKDKGYSSRGLFKKALTKYFNFPDNRYGSEAVKEALWKLFRCGLAHQSFVKLGVATTRKLEQKYKCCHLKRVRVEGELLLFIHPDVFAHDFFKAVEKFRSSLEDDPEKIGKAYRAIHKIYEEASSIDVSSIEECRLHIRADFTRLPQPVWMEKSEVSVF